MILDWSSFKQALERRRRPRLAVHRIATLEGYRRYCAGSRETYAARRERERAWSQSGEPFDTPGYCFVCRQGTRFHTDYLYSSVAASGARVPNWRERVVCPGCGLNNRMRAVAQLLEEVCRARNGDRIYVMEQVTPLYRALRERYPALVGSEYLGGQNAPGETNAAGIRNESAVRLSFADRSFDFILSFDVLEHIPEYLRAARECRRCLAPGGTLLLSVPFGLEQYEHRVRARMAEGGRVEHLMEPLYHGDPMSAGCLCFQEFGWQLLDELRDAGFADTSMLFYWSDTYGYLGMDQIMILARAG